MKVKDLILILLDMNLNKEVTIEYPSADGKIVGNYSRYAEARDFEVNEFGHGVIIGIEK